MTISVVDLLPKRREAQHPERRFKMESRETETRANKDDLLLEMWTGDIGEWACAFGRHHQRRRQVYIL